MGRVDRIDLIEEDDKSGHADLTGERDLVSYATGQAGHSRHHENGAIEPDEMRYEICRWPCRL